MASNGTTNALLTAHLSSHDGNELDVFVEHAGDPLPLRSTNLVATATDGAGEAKAIPMACAPREERPAGEPDGVCSHYVGKAPWIRGGEALQVEASLDVPEGRETFVWRDFDPKRYAHHED